MGSYADCMDFTARVRALSGAIFVVLNADPETEAALSFRKN